MSFSKMLPFNWSTEEVNDDYLLQAEAKSQLQRFRKKDMDAYQDILTTFFERTKGPSQLFIDWHFVLSKTQRRCT